MITIVDRKTMLNRSMSRYISKKKLLRYVFPFFINVSYALDVIRLSIIISVLLALQPLYGDKSYTRDYFIPEPLHFDLVRNLGAKKGELEVNVLATAAKGNPYGFAPEIEYAFLDNHAIELELPFEGTHWESIKMGYQYTLPVCCIRSYIHGLQFLVEKGVHGFDFFQATGMYVSGYKLDENIGFMFINGLQINRGKGQRTGILGEVLFWDEKPFYPFWEKQPIRDTFSYIHNANIFYDFSETWIFGFEINTHWDFKKQKDILFLPNIKYNITKHSSIHFGVGALKEEVDKRYRATGVIRAILEL
jgi:hypothetical protein